MSLEAWTLFSICLAPVLFFCVAGTVWIIVSVRVGWKPKAVGFVLGTVLGGAVCIFTLYSGRIIEHFWVRSANKAVHTKLEQLPHVDDIELAAVRDTSFYFQTGGCGGVYGRLWILFGTSLPAQEAYDLYTLRLLDSGWVARERKYESSRGFERGSNDCLNMSYGGVPGIAWNWGKHSDYLAAIENYPELLKVRIDHITPSGIECGWR